MNRRYGRDELGLWELSVHWYQLPDNAQVSASVDFFDRARLDVDDVLGDEPQFGGSLLRCWEGGCVAVDRYAFHSSYSVNRPDYVSGSGRRHGVGIPRELMMATDRAG